MGDKESATHLVVGTYELNFLVFLEWLGFVVLKLLLIECLVVTSTSAELYMEIMKLYPRTFSPRLYMHIAYGIRYYMLGVYLRLFIRESLF